ncbi:NAD(P)-dependent oxidoreductase [Algoriphagus namhaensis]
MKTIALFGATGRTGQTFMEKALSAGYSVKVLVRTPEKLKLVHSKLDLLEGNVLNEELVIRGSDVVVSLFCHVKVSPEDLQTQGTGHIIKGMKAQGIQRIISLSGGGLPYPDKD